MTGRKREKFVKNERGSILVEALLLLPVVTIFSIGILEFGNVLWQRHQIQVGVRDAARYWSRCRPDFGPCSVDVARNIAFYGNPAGSGNLRVPGWWGAADLSISPSPPPSAPAPSDVVTVTGTNDYLGSPLFGALNISVIEISYTHTERYLGW